MTLDKDRPGTLAQAAAAIANAGINIEGFCEVGGQFHTVTNDPPGAKTALESAGYNVWEIDVVVFPAEDRPGIPRRGPEARHERRDQRQRGIHADDTRVAIGAE